MATLKRCIVFMWIGFGVAVLIASTVIAFLVRFKQFDGHSYLLGPGDQKPILSGLLNGESFSSYYCQDLSVSVADASKEGAVFNAYVLPAVPAPSGDSFRQAVKTTTAIGPAGVSPPIVFNLHREQRAVAWMKIHACSDTTALALYRCQDEAAASAWEEKGDNRRCAMVCEYSRCGAATENYCVFVAHSTYRVDEFVLMLAELEDSPSVSRARVHVNITRFPYDLRVHSAACLNVTRCDLPIVMAETEAVVLEIPSRVTNDPITLETECKPRVGIYFAFYLGIPLAVILAASLFVFLPCLLLQKTLKRQAFELKVKGLKDIRQATLPGSPSEHDGAGLLENEHLNDDWNPEE